MARVAWVGLLVLASSAVVAGATGDVEFPLAAKALEGKASAAQTTVDFIEDRGDITLMALQGNYDRNLADGSFNQVPRQQVARAFYAQHPDDYDFLVVFTTFEFDTGDALAFHASVRNDVKGIGLAQFDHSAQFGSMGRLQGYIDMAAMSRGTFNPLDPAYDQKLDTQAHELMHQWGIYIGFMRADGTTSDDLLGRERAHWSFFVDSDASLMLGNDWRDELDGRYTSVATHERYSDLDLYLAGLLPADQVAPTTLIHGAPGVAEDLPRAGAVVTGTAETVAVQQIIDLEGPREPDFTHSQKQFHAAYVLLIRPGTAVDEDNFVALNRFRRESQTRFSILTHGQAVLRIQTAADPTPGGAPIPISGGDPQTHPAPVTAAIAWLRSRQRADGSWLDKAPTQVRDSVAALRALKILDGGFAGLARAADWVAAREAENQDQLAWLLLSGRPGNAADLQARQFADGGWGIGGTFHSAPYDTAILLRGLAQTGARGSAPGQAASAYLEDQQNSDGGWPLVAAGASRIIATAAAIDALSGLNGAQNALQRARSWLLARQNDDGGFGNSPSTPLASAAAMLALTRAGDGVAGALARATAYLGAHQSADGSWEGSVYTTARVAQAMANQSLPNLKITAPLLQPVMPADGQAVQVGVQVVNDGATGAAATVLQARLDGQAVEEIAVPVIAAGASASLALTLDTFGLEGTHTLQLTVDPDDSVAELSNDDNTVSLSLEVGPPPAGVELGLQALTAVPAQISRLPQALAITARVRNSGALGAHDVVVRLRGPAGTLAEQTMDLAARQSLALHFDVQLEQRPRLPLSIVVDPDNAIAETVEEDNSGSLPLLLLDTIDLGVRGADLSISPDPLAQGETGMISLRATNHGTLPSGPFGLRVDVVDAAGSESLVTEQSVHIDAGQAFQASFPWEAGLDGELQLRVQLDPPNRIVESDESNNVATLPFTVSAASLPNLKISGDDIALAPAPLLAGKPFDATVRVHNTGAALGHEFRVGVFAGQPGGSGTAIGTGSSGVGIAAGGEISVVVPVAAAPAAGSDVVISVVVDSDASVSELNEADNDAFVLSDVLSRPDLLAAADGIVLAPSHPALNQVQQLTASIRNVGQQATGAFRLQLYEGRPGAGGVAVGEALSWPSLGAGAQRPAAFSWTLGVSGAPEVLTLVVDTDQQVDESDELNNALEIPLSFVAGVLTASERYISPNGDGVRDRVRFSINPAPGQTPQRLLLVDDLNRTVRAFPGRQLAATGLSVIEWDARDDDDHIVPDGDYRALLLDARTQLTSVSVSVDSNHLPLLVAAGSDYDRFTPLSCQAEFRDLDNGPLSAQTSGFDPSGRSVFFRGYPLDMAPGEAGVYRIDVNQPGQLLPLIAASFIRSTGRVMVGAQASPRGSMVAAEIGEPKDAGGHRDRSVWSANADGSALALRYRSTSSVTILGFVGESSLLVRDEAKAQGERIELVDLTGAGATRQLNGSGYSGLFAPVLGGAAALLRDGTLLPLDGSPPSVDLKGAGTDADHDHWTLSADGRYLAFIHDVNGHSGPQIFDLETGNRVSLPLAAPEACGQHCAMVFSPRSNRLVVLDGVRWRVETYTVDGELRSGFDIPGKDAIMPAFDDFAQNDPLTGLKVMVEAFSDPLWDAAGKRLATRFHLYFQDNFKRVARAKAFGDSPDATGLLVIDVDRQKVRAVAWDETAIDPAPMLPAGIAVNTGLTTGKLLAWQPQQNALLFHGGHNASGEALDLWGIRLRNDARRVLLDDAIREDPLLLQGGGARSISADAQRILVTRNRFPFNGNCRENGAGVVESWANLTTRLSLRAFPQGVLVRATASDWNFDHWQLDWADAATTDAWFPVVAGDADELFDENALLWTPPAGGAYRLRLRTFDRAGNRRERVQTVQWQGDATITDVTAGPRFISPNNDGIQDRLRISYQVRKPVLATLQILDGNGDVVHSEAISHSAPLAEPVVLHWDGRNDRGEVVADGDYRVALLNSVLPVTVDTTPPEVSLRLQRAFPPPGSVIDFAQTPRLDYHIAEAHVAGAELFVGDGPNPAQWRLDRPVATLDEGAVALRLADYQGHSFALEVTDKAGNATRMVAAAGARDVILYAIDFGAFAQVRTSSIAYGANTPTADTTPGGLLCDGMGCNVELSALQSVDLFLAETLVAQIADVQLEFRDRDDPRPSWQTQPLIALDDGAAGIGNDANRGVYRWTLPVLDAHTSYLVRLRALTANNEVIHSNAVVLSAAGPDAGGGGPPPSSRPGCNEVQVRVVATSLRADSCTEVSAPGLALRFSMPAGLHLANVRVALAGAGTLAAADDLFAPADADQVTLRLDEAALAALPEGVYSATLQADGGSCGSVSQRLLIPVDRTPATLAITRPADAARVCPLRVVASDIPVTRYKYVLPVEAAMDDNMGMAWALRLNPQGAGDAFIDFHDTVQPDQARLIENLTRHHSGSLLLADVSTISALPGFTGDLQMTLMGADLSGAHSCQSVSVSLDTRVEAGVADTSGSLFSPNADGNLDTVAIRYFAREPTDLHVAVAAAPVDASGNPQAASTPLGELFSRVDFEGDASLDFDGRLANGDALGDGWYALNFKFVDACGLESSTRVLAQIDTLAPAVGIDFPVGGEPLADVVQVRGHVIDDNLLTYELLVGAGTSPTSWVKIGEGTQSGNEQVLGEWTLSGFSGQQTLLLRAFDRAGNSARATRLIDLGQSTRLLDDARVTPSLISPNGDGQIDTAAIEIALAQPATVDVSIQNDQGDIVRTLASDLAQQASAQWSVDGRDEQGAILADGEYTVVIRAHVGTLTAQADLRLVIDNTAPVTRVLSPPGDFAKAGDALSIGLDELHFAGGSVRLVDSAGTVHGPFALDGTERQRVGDFSAVPEGASVIEIAAGDTAGNRATLQADVTIDNTPPVVNLKQPLDGAVVGKKNGSIAVAAEVIEDHLDRILVELAPAGGGSWQTLLESDHLPGTGHLFDWLPTQADGAYRLRVSARDKAGWVSRSGADITIDNSAPRLAISAPAAGAFLTAGTPIDGRVEDANLAQFQLSLAPDDGSGRWTDLFVGTASVTGGTLYTVQALPPDGDFLLRLRGEDQAGNDAQSVVPVQVDTTPPDAPQSLLGQVEDNRHVELTWQGSSAPDVIAYRVFADGLEISPAPSPDTRFTQRDAPEGERDYQVAALDRAGNRSALSNPVRLLVDHTPPQVRLDQPRDAARLSGEVVVIGSATSVDDDFKAYRVSLENPVGASPQAIGGAAVAVTAGELARWSSRGVVDDADVAIVLEAEDIHGNRAQTRALVHLDNHPPAAPLGLVAEIRAGDVALHWSANSELDLQGYLLYRGERLLTGTAGSPQALRAAAIVDTAFVDPNAPDGPQRYRLRAIDTAGNVSPYSAAVEVDKDTRAPHMELLQPQADQRFEDQLYVLAVSDDHDIARVDLEYRQSPAGPWTPFAADLTQAPYQADWQPGDLDFGRYEIRAVATDQGGLSDPDPPLASVEFTDLTPPDSAGELAARVDGGSVHLGWRKATAGDLAGYFVERREVAGDSPQRLNTAPLTALEYTDTGLGNGGYAYRIIVADKTGNESAPTAEARVRVWTPEVDQPYTPRQQTRLTLSGQSAVPGGVAVEVTAAAQSSQLDGGSSAADGAFNVADVTLFQGANDVAVQVTDADGNRSRALHKTVVVAQAPGAPTGLSHSVSGDRVSLAWSPNPEPDILGYRVLRDGDTLLPDVAIGDALTPSASSQFDYATRAELALDGDPQTFWQAQQPTANGDVWWQANWDTPRIITRVSLLWSAGGALPRHVVLQGDADGVWVVLAEADVNGPAGLLQPEQAYRTQGLRLRLQAEAGALAQLAEVEISTRPLLSETQFSERLSDGAYAYQLIAVNQFAFESAPSATLSVAVGDTRAPPAVSLSASVDGDRVALTWSASDATDFAHYLLLRDEQAIAMPDDRATTHWLDAAVANGVHRYRVLVVDQVGNRSPPSNTVEVTIAVEGPDAPADLSVSAPAEGRSLLLQWSAASAATHYQLSRARSSGGPYTDLPVVAQNRYRDSGLVDGVTYYYVVAAVDAAGNHSVVSNEAHGVPEDRLPPDAPRIFAPARPDMPVQRTHPQVTVAGVAEPGSTVVVLVNGAAAGESDALADFDTRRATGVGTAVSRLSPDGRLLMVRDDSFFGNTAGRFLVGAFASGETPQVLPDTAHTPSWRSDSRAVILAPSNRSTAQIIALDLPTLAETPLLEMQQINGFSASPSGRYLLVSGQRRDNAGLVQQGAWLVETESGGLQSIATQGDFFAEANLAGVSWNAGESAVAWVRLDQGVWRAQWLDRATLAVTTLADAVEATALAWFTADQIAYIAAGEVHRYRLSDGTDQVEVLDVAASRALAISPDGSRMAVLDDSGSMLLLDLAGGVRDGFAAVDNAISVAWTGAGLLHVVTTDAQLRIGMPGQFVLHDAVLAGGDNRITAVATDAAGNASTAAAEVRVHVPAAGLPDLSLVRRDLVVLPGAGLPGESFRTTITVRNLSTVAAPASDLNVILLRPDGASRSLLVGASLPALAGGAAATRSLSFGIGQTAGVYRIFASVDGANALGEGDESNNTAVRELPVGAPAQPVLSVVAAQMVFAPDSQVQGSVEVANSGGEFRGQLTVSVEDAAGVFIALLHNETLQLGFSAVADRDLRWDGSGVFAGDYRLHARVYDGGGALVAESQAGFAIARVENVTLDITGPGAAQVGDTPAFDINVNYRSGNAVLGDAGLQVTGLAADGSQRDLGAIALGLLLPGQQTSVQVNWPQIGPLAGVYRIRAELQTDTQNLTAERSLTVSDADQVVALSGEIRIERNNLPAGDALAVDYRLSNTGTAPLQDLPIHLDLLDADTLQVRDSVASRIDLAVGDTLGLSHTFATDDLDVGAWLLVLRADLPTRAKALNDTPLAQISFNTVDQEAPSVTLLKPLPGSVRNVNVTVLASAADRLSRVASAELRLDDGAWMVMGLAGGAAATHQRDLSGLPSGMHTLAVRATDVWGNTGFSAPVQLTVDGDAPEIHIQGVTDGELRNTDVTPVFSASDAHLQSLRATLNGAPFAGGDVVHAEGAYTLVVSALDTVGNRSQLAVGFTLDRTPPPLSLAAPLDGARITSDRVDVVGRSEALARIRLRTPDHQQQLPAGADGEFVFADVALAQGDNHLLLEATDRAGNTSAPLEVVVRHVVDGPILHGGLSADASRFQPGRALVLAYRVVNDGDDEAAAVEIRVRAQTSGVSPSTLDDVAGLDLDISDQFQSDLAVDTADWQLGERIVGLQARIGAAGAWLTLDQVRLQVVDLTAPELLLLSPEAGEVTLPDVTVRVHAEDVLSGLQSVAMRVDGGAWQELAPEPGQSHEFGNQLRALSGGAHQLELRAIDQAGNTASLAPRSFRVQAPPLPLAVFSPSNGARLPLPVVDVRGVTAPGAVLHLALNGKSFTVSADAGGLFVLTGLGLQAGNNRLSLFAVDSTGNRSAEVILSVQFAAASNAPARIPVLGVPGIWILIVMVMGLAWWLRHARRGRLW